MNNPPTLPPEVTARQAEQAQDDVAGAKAVTEPMPGPVKRAFAPNKEIQVGKWTIRPFKASDIEMCSFLHNPLLKVMAVYMDPELPDEEFKKKVAEILLEVSSGQHAWNLCWLMTHPPREARQLYREKGEVGICEAAAAEWGDVLTANEIVPVAQACADQFIASSTTRLEYEPNDTSKESGGATSEKNPT